MREPYTGGKSNGRPETFLSSVGTRLLLLRCNFVRLRYVPEQKVSDVPPLGQCFPWMIRSLDEASFGRRVPWTMRPLDDAWLTDVS
jgi:hypothetical protein